MSCNLFGDDVLFTQRLLSCCGLYDRKIDGVWGGHTSDAEEKFFTKSKQLADSLGLFDERSERNIKSLQLAAQEVARTALAALRKTGADVRILSGTRTYAEQAALYAKGRSKPGPIVTNAKAGQSWHNFGLAWDIGLFVEKAYITDGAQYKAFGPIAKAAAGVEWGGDWTTFKDYPHYQLTKGQTSISAARNYFEAGGRKP